MRIAIDTNILLRYSNRTDAQHEKVVALLGATASAGGDVTLSPQNLYEFWVVATRPISANGLGLDIAATRRHFDRC